MTAPPLSLPQMHEDLDNVQAYIFGFLQNIASGDENSDTEKRRKAITTDHGPKRKELASFFDY